MSFKYMTHTLRPYQLAAIDGIFAAFRAGHRAVLFQQPTGTGKTVIFSEITKKGYDHARRVMIVVHRRELIQQAVNHLHRHGIEPGIILSGVTPQPDKLVQVASVQTLARRDAPDTDLLIIDEAHHAAAESYRRLWEEFPTAKILGVTATPCRMDGKGFGDLFDTLITSPQIRQFVADGHLAPVKHFIGATPDTSTVNKQRGDYVTAQLSAVMTQENLLVNLVDSYHTHADGLSCIVFAVDVDHSHEIVTRYTDAGLRAAHVDGNTPTAERERILAAFTRKEIRILSNVGIISEGFDMPSCEVVQLARPTKSLSLFLQMTGRVMRPAADKPHGLVLDCAGCWLEHGVCQSERTWTLQGAASKPNAPRYGRDKDGEVINLRERPGETDGLELIEATEALEKLLMFDRIFKEVMAREYKPIAAFYKFKEWVEQRGEALTLREFDYMKPRLLTLNRLAPKDKQFNPYFLTRQRAELTQRV